MTSESAISVLLDPIRLMVAGSLLQHGRTTAQVSEHTGAAPEAIIQAIDELCEIGLVEQRDDTFVLPAAGFDRILAELGQDNVDRG